MASRPLAPFACGLVALALSGLGGAHADDRLSTSDAAGNATIQPSSDSLAKLAVYDGSWSVRAAHPWSGAPVGAIDRLESRCRRFTAFFACEQTVNGKPLTLIVFTAGDAPGRLHTRTIAPDGRASSRGDLTLEGRHWTYLDKPPAGLEGPWSRVENVIVDHDHIRFEEYESTDAGKTWTRVNNGTEDRVDGTGSARSPQGGAGCRPGGTAGHGGSHTACGDARGKPSQPDQEKP